MTTCPLSAYKNVFGEQGTGLHQYKFKGTSIFDYFFIIACAFALTFFTDIPLVLTTIGLLLLGILAHTLVGLPTQTVKYLGLTC